MTSEKALRMTPRILLGVFLMGIGLVFGLDSLGVVDAGNLIRFWPVILIVGGLVKLACPGCAAAGVFWVAVGSGLLLHTLEIIQIWRLWPFGLVLIGGHIAYRALWQSGRTRDMPSSGGREVQLDVAVGDRPRPAAPATEGATLSIVAIMGGVERTVRTRDFRGGSLVAFMGGCEIDLRESSIEGDEVVIDTTAIWGGIELKIPSDWRVESRGVAFLGGFADKTHAPADSPKRLVVTGLAVMGGVEIRN